MKDKKVIIAIVALVLIAGGGGFFTYKTLNKKSSIKIGTGLVSPTNSRPTVTTKKEVPTLAATENEKEPQITLTINSSRTGGTLTVAEIDPSFAKIEYEFIYKSPFKDSVVERGISSGGSIIVPSSRILKKDLIFGVESCTTGKCHFSAEEVVVDEPATLIIRLLNEEDQVREIQKTISFEKAGTAYRAIFQE